MVLRYNAEIKLPKCPHCVISPWYLNDIVSYCTHDHLDMRPWYFQPRQEQCVVPWLDNHVLEFSIRLLIVQHQVLQFRYQVTLVQYQVTLVQYQVTLVQQQVTPVQHQVLQFSRFSGSIRYASSATVLFISKDLMSSYCELCLRGYQCC